MKILLTGANGYIGRRLLPVLILKGHDVVCLVRDRRRLKIEKDLIDKVTFFEADLLKKETLEKLPADLDASFYLVHSMGLSSKGFYEREQQSAENYVDAISKTNIQHIIFLSGIANENKLSDHLRSRKNVEQILLNSGVNTTILRAAIIIGSGGASFEIIRDLVEKLPVMITPKWVKTRCQPISIRNVVGYLEKVLLEPRAYNKIFDIGGPDILSYKEMLLRFARVRGFRRWIITLPVLTPRISSYWLYFVTSTSFPLAKSLVDSMKHEVIVQNKGLDEIIPIDLLNYEDAIKVAFDRIAQNEVISSWKDALASSETDTGLMQHIKVPQYGCFVDKRSKRIKKDTNQVIRNIWSIGGKQGWYSMNFLWEIRGLLDKMAGGVGLRRGRRNAAQIQPGDALDFWRVLVADRNEQRLLLYAEMKLPGEAWLEFKIENENGKENLVQTATFRPDGIKGRLYWYLLYPIHSLIFDRMAYQVVHRTERV